MKLAIVGPGSTQPRLAVEQVKQAFNEVRQYLPTITQVTTYGKRGVAGAVRTYINNFCETQTFSNRSDMVASSDAMLALWSGSLCVNHAIINCMSAHGKPIFIVDPDQPGKVASSINISSRKLCEFKGWKPGTVVEYLGTVLRIESIDGETVYGRRCNEFEHEFGNLMDIYPHWGYTKVEELSDEPAN